ncbi:MAG TPA: lysophospholipid acyltransferase family protein [Edaphocola sp.]|nr:lysophospholipid acyltransferase family protein [Edaphocola sp.]
MRYLYTIYAVTLFLAGFVITMPVIFLFHFFKNGQEYNWYILKFWSRCWFFLLGIQVSVSFPEEFKAFPPYIIVANHSSFLDTPFLFRCCPFPVLPLATAGFAKIPLFGFLYKEMTVLVQRQSLSSRRQSFRRLKKALNRGKSIFIFPEGGFKQSENTLQPFYDGAFRLSKETGVPVLPVAFPDTAQRWRPTSFWHWHPGKCRAIFSGPIYPQGKSTKEIKNIAAQKIAEALTAVDR